MKKLSIILLPLILVACSSRDQDKVAEDILVPSFLRSADTASSNEVNHTDRCE
jgi:hypothetical protein